jgi:hypothetical protein
MEVKVIKAHCDNQIAKLFEGRGVKATVMGQKAIVTGVPDCSAGDIHPLPYLRAEFQNEVGKCAWDNAEDATDAEQATIDSLKTWSA